MFITRRLASALPRASSQRAWFHSTRPAFVKVGDSIPNLDILVEGSPGNKVNLAAELSGNGIIVGVPAAFSTCLSSNANPRSDLWRFAREMARNKMKRKDVLHGTWLTSFHSSKRFRCRPCVLLYSCTRLHQSSQTEGGGEGVRDCSQRRFRVSE
jgi:hypothetical protein